MKLINTRRAEFKRLVSYFQKIETMAEKMGLQVDDLVPERRTERNHTGLDERNELKLLGANRRIEFRNSNLDKTGNGTRPL